MIRIRYATQDDVGRIKEILDMEKLIFGFIVHPAIAASVEKGELVIAESDEVKPNIQIIGLCRFHKRRDGQTTIYELFVAKSYRRRGIGKQLIQDFEPPVLAKCPVYLFDASRFYKAMGFDLVRTETGKRRELNVWVKS